MESLISFSCLGVVKYSFHSENCCFVYPVVDLNILLGGGGGGGNTNMWLKVTNII